MTLLLAEGPSFSFIVLSDSKSGADKAFRKAWKKHVKQTGATQDPEDAVTINYIDHLKQDQVYRDYEPL